MATTDTNRIRITQFAIFGGVLIWRFSAKSPNRQIINKMAIIVTLVQSPALTVVITVSVQAIHPARDTCKNICDLASSHNTQERDSHDYTRLSHQNVWRAVNILTCSC